VPARRVAVLVGSLRKDAYSLQAAEALRSLAPPTLHFERVEIGALPFYNHDLETDRPPPAWVEFRELFTKYLAAFAGWIERCYIGAGKRGESGA
jgi:NAD(P)H-dependent FMN reductase